MQVTATMPPTRRWRGLPKVKRVKSERMRDEDRRKIFSGVNMYERFQRTSTATLRFESQDRHALQPLQAPSKRCHIRRPARSVIRMQVLPCGGPNPSLDFWIRGRGTCYARLDTEPNLCCAWRCLYCFSSQQSFNRHALPPVQPSGFWWHSPHLVDAAGLVDSLGGWRVL